jgi:poly-gamma-glutamate system protein
MLRPALGRYRVAPAALLAAVVLLSAAVWAVERAGRDRGARPGSERALRAEAATSRYLVAAALLRERRAALGLPQAAGVPAARAGLIGSELTPLVTTLGSLEAKVLAASPAWPAELIRRLDAAGIGNGDVVAASFSGSFPGLNLALIAACGQLGVRLVAVSSVTASTWGATDPGMTWPEMEAHLAAAGVLAPATVAVAVGGEDDRGADLAPAGRDLAEAIARRAATALGAVVLTPATLSDACAQRLRVYAQYAGRSPLALYVSVGGAHASLGASQAILRVRTGFVAGEPFDLSRERGVMARLAERGVPGLLLLNVAELAARWRVDG